MTALQQPAKATMQKLSPDGQPLADTKMTVQFNPETLKVNYSNQVVSQNTPSSEEDNTSSAQATGGANSKLSVELVLDVTAPLPEGLSLYSENTNTPVPNDVRRLTKHVSDFLRPPEGERQPLVVRFLWGTFMFDGLIESVDETLEFFSPEGVPLRASLSFGMVQQSLTMDFADLQQDDVPSASDTGQPTGTQPTALTKEGDSMSDVQQREKIPKDQVKPIARQNGIENLRRLPVGQRLNLTPPVKKQARREAERTETPWHDFAQQQNLPTPPQVGSTTNPAQDFPSLPPDTLSGLS